MEQFRKFLRDKAFALVLTACLLAAAAAGVWAVRTVRNELKKDLDAVRSPSSTAPGIDEGINTSPGVAGEEEPNGSSRTHPQQTVWPMCQKPTARPVGLRPLLVRGLALVRCANPPRCKPSPCLPAVRLRLPPRSLSRGAS